MCYTGLLPRSNVCTLRVTCYGIHAEPQPFRLYKALRLTRLFAYKRLRNASLYLCWPRKLYYAAVFVNSARVHFSLFPVTFLVFLLRHCYCNLGTVCRRTGLVISHLRQQSFASCVSSEMCVCMCVCIYRRPAFSVLSNTYNYLSNKM